jgi:hypothetical protein
MFFFKKNKAPLRAQKSALGIVTLKNKANARKAPLRAF